MSQIGIVAILTIAGETAPTAILRRGCNYDMDR